MLILQGCASVDQYGSRILDANLNSQNALNQEILLNIVRASRFQSGNFIAISQITGGQSEQLSTGLPTISLGPGQTAANHVYQVSNSVVSGVTGGYQSNPLISTAFQNGMLTPVSPRTVALLIGSHPREIVFFLLVNGIEVKLHTGETVFLGNDPSLDLPPDGDPRGCDDIVSSSSGKELLYPGGVCTYTKFSFLMKSLIGNGLTAELIDSGSPANQGASSSSGSSGSSVGLPGQLCFDPALGGKNYQIEIGRNFKNICGPANPKSPKPTLTATNSLSVKTTAADKTETTKSTSTTGPIQEPSLPKNISFNYPGFGKVELRPVFRSPIGVINYLGVFLRQQPLFAHYVTYRAQQVLPENEPYLNVVPISAGGCYTSLNYMGQSYCVPATSMHTAMIMDIVETLRNLSITPADLNSAFTVRLAP